MCKVNGFREMDRILAKNDWVYDRTKGSHFIYEKDGRIIVVPYKLKVVIANKIIKENNLVL